MRKSIRIATSGLPDDYKTSLVPRIIKSLGYSIEWTKSSKADLNIFGPNFKERKKYYWAPKPLRPIFQKIYKIPDRPSSLTLYQTGENTRHNFIAADYSLSSDLAVNSPFHIRLPYWMEQIDWTHEGIEATRNTRFGTPISLIKLTQPLGNNFLKKPPKVALFSSHMNEPRQTLHNAVSAILPTSCFGPYFNSQITHHNASGFYKKDILENFRFNLCPENGMYPGYYTEKIPESFMADSLPLAWTDDNVDVDFNPKAFINLAPMMKSNFEELRFILTSESRLEEYAAESLMSKIPNLDMHKKFILEILKSAIS